MSRALLIERLSVGFGRGAASAVRDVSLTVDTAECVGIVGESGSGKTLVCMAVMGLLPASAVATGCIEFLGLDMLTATPRELNAVRGSKLSMIFQDPMTSLTPHLRIGVQLAEVLVAHSALSRRAARRAALDMLERVRIGEAERRLRQYPHELSGGMRQRVMIGMSLLCRPALLIADEPTTALDVTIQAQIMDLLRAMREELRMGILLVSHDLGVVGGLADRIVVMYAGRVVESGATARLLSSPAHPYTAALLACVPSLRGPRLPRMPSLAGAVPGTSTPGAPTEAGCAFAPRCTRSQDRCRTERPLLEGAGTGTGAGSGGTAHQVACHFPLPP